MKLLQKDMQVVVFYSSFSTTSFEEAVQNVTRPATQKKCSESCGIYTQRLGSLVEHHPLLNDPLPCLSKTKICSCFGFQDHWGCERLWMIEVERSLLVCSRGSFQAALSNMQGSLYYWFVAISSFPNKNLPKSCGK